MNPTQPEVPFEDRSPRAFACYRELVEEANREPVVIVRDSVVSQRLHIRAS